MAIDPFVGMTVAAVCVGLLNAIAIDRVRRQMRGQAAAIDALAAEQGLRVEVWPDGTTDAYEPDVHGVDVGGYTYHDSKSKAVNP